MSKFSIIYLRSFFILISILSIFNIIYSYYFNLYLNLSSYLPTMVISFIFVIVFFLVKSKDYKQSLFKKILSVVIGYFLIPIIICLPYYFSIYNISFLNSYFEAISGFTSTGFTIFDNIKHIDQSLIIWRSTTQWIGGLYFLFSIIILIDIFDESLKKSLTNFLSFNSAELLKQSIKVFILYIVLTIFIFFVLKIINLRNFDAFNLSLTIIASGGFKPINELDYILNNDFKKILFSLTLLISFFSIFLSYNILFLKNKYLNFFSEDFYLLIYLISIISIFFIFFSDNNFSSLILSITSSVSNIGFYLNENNNNLSFIYLILVIIGGSFFSTSSGLRFFKIFTLFKFSLNELLSHTKPKQILLSKIIFDDKKIDYDVINKYFLSIIIFILSLTLLSTLLSINDIDFSTSIKLGILTIMNTVNSGLYDLNNFDFYNLSVINKIVLINFMIIGRVEFITLIILIKKYLLKN